LKQQAALGKTQVNEWFSRFRNDELSLADQPRSVQPSTSQMDENIVIIHELILEDCRKTTDKLVDLSGVTWSTCQRILSEELQMKRVAAHKALSVKPFLNNNSMIQLIHPPYSPDLTPCNFSLFP
jgi:hypothetical protein